jgi:ribosomal protein L3 glutamine methyltransferase
VTEWIDKQFLLQKVDLLQRLSEAKTELRSLADWLRFIAKQFEESDLFYGHGTDNAWDEALALVLWQAGIPWGKETPLMSATLLASEKTALCEAIAKRISHRIPLPYITGQAYFADLRFRVTPEVLIPRSPFAELIQNGFQPWLTQPPRRVLDLCAGSGCIGIATALLFEDSEVDLADISPAALEICAHNIAYYQLQDRVSPVLSDVLSGLTGREYDLIVCNPPYVNAEDLAAMPPEFQHEPALALGSGDDGLDFTRRLLHQVEQHLGESGLLFVEVGNSWPALESAFPELPFTWIELAQGGHGIFVLTAADLKIAFSNDGIEDENVPWSQEGLDENNRAAADLSMTSNIDWQEMCENPPSDHITK